MVKALCRWKLRAESLGPRPPPPALHLVITQCLHTSPGGGSLPLMGVHVLFQNVSLCTDQKSIIIL